MLLKSHINIIFGISLISLWKLGRSAVPPGVGVDGEHVEPRVPMGVDCPWAVARGDIPEPITNMECQIMCEEEQLTFSDYCIWELVKVRLPRDKDIDWEYASCFTPFVWGFPEIVGMGDTNIGTFTSIQDGPHGCQEECQYTDGCIAFMWRATYSDGQPTGTCLLLDTEQMSDALIWGTETSPVQCPALRYKLCEKLPHYCATCNGSHTCIWRNHNWIAGPRYCPTKYPRFCEHLEIPPFPYPGENPDGDDGWWYPGQPLPGESGNGGNGGGGNGGGWGWTTETSETEEMTETHDTDEPVGPQEPGTEEGDLCYCKCTETPAEKCGGCCEAALDF